MPTIFKASGVNGVQPSTSEHQRSQVGNDCRIFVPFIGLCMSSVWAGVRARETKWTHKLGLPLGYSYSFIEWPAVFAPLVKNKEVVGARSLVVDQMTLLVSSVTLLT